MSYSWGMIFHIEDLINHSLGLKFWYLIIIIFLLELLRLHTKRIIYLYFSQTNLTFHDSLSNGLKNFKSFLQTHKSYLLPNIHNWFSSHINDCFLSLTSYAEIQTYFRYNGLFHMLKLKLIWKRQCFFLCFQHPHSHIFFIITESTSKIITCFSI